jgi:hypothetical protein
MFDVVTKIKFCAYSKNPAPVVEPSAMRMETIHITKMQK